MLIRKFPKTKINLITKTFLLKILLKKSKIIKKKKASKIKII